MSVYCFFCNLLSLINYAIFTIFFLFQIFLLDSKPNLLLKIWRYLFSIEKENLHFFMFSRQNGIQLLSSVGALGVFGYFLFNNTIFTGDK